MGPKIIKPEPMDTQGYPKMLKKFSSPGRWWSTRRGGKKLEDCRTKEKNDKTRVSEASEQVWNGRFYRAKTDCGTSFERRS